MGFWSWLTAAPNHEGITPNENPPGDPASVGEPDYTPGDPEGVELQGEDTFSRALPYPHASPWDGWPGDWSTPNWQGGIQRLVDTAWDCLDLNASALSTMPVYRTQSSEIVAPLSWMSNPDPAIYTSWHEFAKQLFWDYQMGEAFVMPSDFFAGGAPRTFRVVPPWMVRVEMRSGFREYRIGSIDATEDILHIRYKSVTTEPRGDGPLDGAGARMTAAGVLQRYVAELAQTGGQTHEWLESDKKLTKGEADDQLDQWVDSRKRRLGDPALLSNGITLRQASSMSAKDMALIELSQFTEARIAVKLGVPPFLVGLPTGDSEVYSNVSQLFDFHDRASLRPKATHVMAALSGWALPRGQKVELNRDEYSRPDMQGRAEAYKLFAETGAILQQPVITSDEIRTAERLNGEAPVEALTGGDEL